MEALQFIVHTFRYDVTHVEGEAVGTGDLSLLVGHFIHKYLDIGFHALDVGLNLTLTLQGVQYILSLQLLRAQFLDFHTRLLLLSVSAIVARYLRLSQFLYKLLALRRVVEILHLLSQFITLSVQLAHGNQHGRLYTFINDGLQLQDSRVGSIHSGSYVLALGNNRLQIGSLGSLKFLFLLVQHLFGQCLSAIWTLVIREHSRHDRIPLTKQFFPIRGQCFKLFFGKLNIKFAILYILPVALILGIRTSVSVLLSIYLLNHLIVLCAYAIAILPSLLVILT